MPTVNVALKPLTGSPDTAAISEATPSEKTISVAFDVGFWPLAAYAPVAYTADVTLSGNAICVVARLRYCE